MNNNRVPITQFLDIKFNLPQRKENRRTISSASSFHYGAVIYQECNIVDLGSHNLYTYTDRDTDTQMHRQTQTHMYVCVYFTMYVCTLL